MALTIAALLGTSATAGAQPAPSLTYSDGPVTLTASEPVIVTPFVADSGDLAFGIVGPAGTDTVQLTVTGLSPDTPLYLYRKTLDHPSLVASDADGTLTFTEDVSYPHLVFIYDEPSTVDVSNSDCPAGGPARRDPTASRRSSPRPTAPSTTPSR